MGQSPWCKVSQSSQSVGESGAIQHMKTLLLKSCLEWSNYYNIIHWYQCIAAANDHTYEKALLYLYKNELCPNFHSHEIQYSASPYKGTHPHLITRLPGTFSCHSHASGNASCVWQGGEFHHCIRVCVCGGGCNVNTCTTILRTWISNNMQDDTWLLTSQVNHTHKLAEVTKSDVKLAWVICCYCLMRICTHVQICSICVSVVTI